MRNIKELLQILRDNLREYLNSYSNGICLVVNDLYLDDIISNDEELYLVKFIKITKPEHPEWKDDYQRNDYGWEPGKLQPRLDYLDEYLSKSLKELEEILK